MFLNQNFLSFSCIAFLTLGLHACALWDSDVEKDVSAPEEYNITISPVTFNVLPGWQSDDYKYFERAFKKSCDVIKKKSAATFSQGEQWGTLENWQRVCSDFQTISEDNYRNFFEENFTPVSIQNGSDASGLFTGYYESSLHGSRTQHGKYQYPLYSRPDDLVMVQLGDFRDSLKGQRIAGRIIDGRLRPFESRAEIVNGKIEAEPLVWLDDAVDAFFVQIQGSGVIELDDGALMRIGYAGQNGHPYHAIGRTLIERGALTKETVSMQSIREWLAANPQEVDDVMNMNASYVFFDEITKEGPIGAQGVALTKTRSLAVDHTFIPYGVPLWLDIEYPGHETAHIRRLVVAQDTGGAIRGPVRGDFFWGRGDFAEKKAGIMNSKGRYWALIPR